MSSKKQSVVIIEDHPMVRERLTQIISKEPDLEVRGEADDMRHGLELIRGILPDLAIVDISLKDSNGLDLIKGLKASSVKTPILVFSMHDEAVYAQRALRAGASGYITKDRPSVEVLYAVRQVLAGECYLSQRMTSRVLKGLHNGRNESSVAGSIHRLTDRELVVLEHIGRGCSTRKIAEALQVGAATVDTYRARIKEKLNLQNAAELLHFAINWLRECE